MFVVGQKIICIDASPVRRDCLSSMPVRLVHGTIYTVRSLHHVPHIPDSYGVRLEETLNPSIIWSDGTESEWSYDHKRFKPLLTEKVDAEVSQEAR